MPGLFVRTPLLQCNYVSRYSGLVAGKVSLDDVYQVRWPAAMLIELRALAHQRRSTVAKLIREACIQQYGLTAPPPAPAATNGEG